MQRDHQIMLSSKIVDHENSLVYAQTIQNGLLPKKRHFKNLFKDHFILYQPQHIIGGDFYWLSKKKDTVYFAMADCTGHGIPGAMLSVLGISLLNYALQKNFDNVGDYLTELDSKWIETFNNDHHDTHFNNDWMEITMISYNTKTKEFQYASGGGEFIVCENDTITRLHGNTYPVGGWQIEKNRSFDTFKLTLKEDSKLYFFSDGIKHQFDADNKKKFGRRRLNNIIKHYHSYSMENQSELLSFVFDTWKDGAKQTDDITLIGLQF